MNLLERFANNKGTVSSALGKEIAAQILEGDLELLKEVIPFVCYKLKNHKSKHIRSGAAKVVECIAEKNTDYIVPYLEMILPGLEVEEPQTKWMIFMTLGYCASKKPEIAKSAIPYAKQYILEKVDGQLCLVGAIDIFLGKFGKTSRENAEIAYKLLLESIDNVIMNELDWIIEGFTDIIEYLDNRKKETILSILNEYSDNPKKATQKRMQILKQKCK